ncbi:hypothetical protein HUS23_07105 [Ectothiorhodospiraceae bacterium 2226]|nr:hypothetical protein HUS23_07105 [Ectothiorhodospiraceae bacterium 2226]
MAPQARLGNGYVSKTKESVVCPHFWRKVLGLIGVACALSAHGGESGVPEWLGGVPDIDIKADRCGVYEWFFDKADSQTERMASKEDLASKRLINIVNKLVDHHLSDPAESYGAEVKYFVVGSHEPLHFEFQISRATLERLMSKECG